MKWGARMIEFEPDFISSLHDGTAARLATYSVKLNQIKEQWSQIKYKIYAEEEVNRKDIVAMDELLRDE